MEKKWMNINSYPLKVLLILKISPFKLIRMVIKTYDDSKREVVRVFKTKIKVGPIKTKTGFTLLDILMTFFMLLGRHKSHKHSIKR